MEYILFAVLLVLLISLFIEVRYKSRKFETIVNEKLDDLATYVSRIFHAIRSHDK